MRLRELSIFRRLLLSIAGAGLVVALVSGFAHYLFAERLIRQSVHSEMETALQASESNLERSYAMPVSGDLRLLAASTVVQGFLASFGNDVLLTRPETERLFLSVTGANARLYSSIRLIGVGGIERVIVSHGKRVRSYARLTDGGPADSLRAHLAVLFERLREASPGTVLFEGPVVTGTEKFSFLAGIATRDPDIGGFGGAIVSHFDLSGYLQYLSDFRIFGHSMVWLLDDRGRVVLRPTAGEPSLDPRPWLSGGDGPPHDAVIVASAERAGNDLLGLFRIALSMSPETFATQLHGTEVITLSVLVAAVLLAAVIALGVARQLGIPLTELATMAATVSRGDFRARAPEHWGGEIGLLARAFNRMVRALRDTTVSRAYVDNILRSMNDNLVVLGPDGSIQTVNPSLLALLGYAEEELLGRPLSTIVPDSGAVARVTGTAGGGAAVTALETNFTARDGRSIPLSLSSSVMLSPEGHQEGFVCVAQDMTERKRAEEALRRYERMVGASGDIMTFIDAEHRYQAINDAYLQAFGRSREEVIGRRVAEVTGRAVYETHVREEIDRCLAGEHRHFQLWMEFPAWGRRYLDLRYDPYRDADGTITGVVADVRDITEYKRAEQALLASEKRFRALYDDTPSMFFTMDPEGLILSTNYYGATQLGYTVDELVHLPAWLLYSPEDKMIFQGHLRTCVEAPDAVHRWEMRKLRKDGGTLWVRETGRVVPDLDRRRVVLIVSEDITEAHELSEQLAWQATHDALTGLVNRQEFERRMHLALESARAEQVEHVVCYLDLDQFKVINDTCGHIAGDELLRQLTGLLRTEVRRQDTLARLGGDEFGLLMEHCSIEQARRVADASRRAMETFRFAWEDKSFSVGASIGVVGITAATESVTEALRAADAACYAAKEAGRNRVHVYLPDDAALAVQYGEMQWVARIQRALEEDRFELAYQPIVPIRREAGAGLYYELLLRMLDERGETIPPGAFLPAAERYNLAVRLDRWVVDRALGWLAAHPAHLERVRFCSINLSGRSLSDEDFLAFVSRRLGDAGVPPSKICFEVTETAAIANLASATRFMKALRELGCHFALDDFGSGLSSFAYLKNLPVDLLKIDGMFVRQITNDPMDRAMVKSITDVARVMGKRTVAEFVESAAVLAVLREIGVDYAQGFHIGRPAPLDTLAQREAGRVGLRVAGRREAVGDGVS